MLFNEAENTINTIRNNVTSMNSRISACESSVYNLNNTVYSGGPIWDKIWDIECKVNEFQEVIETIKTQIQVLDGQIQEMLSTTRADLAVKTENPNQKFDLEILEQNIDNKTDPFITPEYYIDIDSEEYRNQRTWCNLGEY